MFTLKKKGRRGFTLIELLVVIAIIGLLASIVLASLAQANMRARDSERISDLHSIRNALELYANAHNGKYPTVTNCGGSLNWYVAIDDGGSCQSNWNSLKSQLAPYITLPSDPVKTVSFGALASGLGYVYSTNVSGSTYDLIAYLEASNSQSCSNQDWKAHTTITYFVNAGSSFCPSGSRPNLYSDRP